VTLFAPTTDRKASLQLHITLAPKRMASPFLKSEDRAANGLRFAFILKMPLFVAYESMTLTIPTERLGNVVLDEREAVVDIAIGLYKREAVSLGRAAEIAGICSNEMLDELGRRHIPINYGVKELREDVATVGKLP
jgi:predicted HTH domain antitoxin